MMGTYTKRVQTTLTPKQYELLTGIAERSRKPLSILIRAAIELTYFTQIDRHQRETVLRKLLTLDAPVSDWEEMEGEIERGALNG